MHRTKQFKDGIRSNKNVLYNIQYFHFNKRACPSNKIITKKK